MNDTAKITLKTPFWLAEFHPESAGNMTRLHHRASGTELVRTPPDAETYLKQPEVWGVPVLFPPNRTPYGKFTFRGREYAMPVNEIARNNNLHGVIMDLPWQYETRENQAILTLHHKSRPIWQHDFTMKMVYDFGETSVQQTLTVTNESPDEMPFFIGFHTALPMPKGRTLRIPRPDWRVTLTPPFHTPDGTRCPNQIPEGFFAGGQPPFAFDDLFPITSDEKGFCGVEVRCPAEKTIYRYTLGAQWKYWMCWNKAGKEDFFCAEPMSGIVDCFHHQEDPDSGFDALKPGKARTLTAEFSIQMEP